MLQRHLGRSAYGHRGRQIIGYRIMQAPSDIFCSGRHGKVGATCTSGSSMKAAAAMITAAVSAHRRPSARLLCHRLLDQAHDDHDDRAADTASGNLPYDRPDIKSAAGRPCNSRYEHAEQLTANAAAHNAGDGVPHRPQAEILKQPSCNVSTDRAANEFDDQG